MLLRFLILLYLFLNLNAVSSATEQKFYKNITTETIINKFFSSSKLVGQATYKFLLLNIYEAKLISETGKFPAEKFALILKYNRDFTKKSVVKETVEQLKFQKKYSENQLIELNKLLNQAFRPIKKNDQFIAIKLKNKGIFYFKNEKVLETNNLEFLNLFFNIWLRENSENPDFTKLLIGKDS